MLTSVSFSSNTTRRTPQALQVCVLAWNRPMVMSMTCLGRRIVAHYCREVSDDYEFVCWTESTNHGNGIEPQVPATEPLAEAVVKVEAIDVRDRAGHRELTTASSSLMR